MDYLLILRRGVELELGGRETGILGPKNRESGIVGSRGMSNVGRSGIFLALLRISWQFFLVSFSNQFYHCY